MPRLDRLTRTAVIVIVLWSTASVAAHPTPAGCARMGWAPSAYNLKDHSVFIYRDMYYLVSISSSASHKEDRFAYARSGDLCNWEDLSPILKDRPAGSWDDVAIWAPFVLEERGVYYMFYTGVTSGMAQSILVATSLHPADPASWRPAGVVFQPAHPGMVWSGRGAWSDARDPMVLKANGLFYLFYTGLDINGGIIGVATAPTPLGPWRDWGAILTVPGAMLESPGMIVQGGAYYLFYNRTLDGNGPEMRSGPTPFGPWSPPRAIRPGWAHEFWKSRDGQWMTSYLTDYTVTISPVAWDDRSAPPWPFIGEQIAHVWLPLSRKDMR